MVKVLHGGGGGGPEFFFFFFLQIFQNIDGFRQKQFTGLLEFIKFCKENPLEKF